MRTQRSSAAEASNDAQLSIASEASADASPLPDSGEHGDASQDAPADADGGATPNCRGPGHFSYGKCEANRPCCPVLTKLYYQERSYLNSVNGCWNLGPEGSYGCISGTCGDGICELGEADHCGCPADCPSSMSRSPLLRRLPEFPDLRN